MKLKISFIFILITFLITFVSADQLINPNDPFIKEKMILSLPELSGFTFSGMWQPYTHIDLRYISPIDSDQHSEFALDIYTSDLEDSFLDSAVEDIIDNWNFSVKNINRNKIFEGVSEIPIGKQKYRLWISGKNYIRSWNGNDMGSVIDDTLFDALTNAYLAKYPSTYSNNELCTDDCSESGQKRCDGNNSQICGNYDNDECLEWNLLMSCPYNCSNGVCNYILEEQENGTIYYISPDKDSGPLEIPEQEDSFGHPLICSSCELGGECYPFGFRKSGRFCSDLTKEFIDQKEEDSPCENNFECSTNLCIDSQCVSSGLWQRFLRWIRNLFG